MVDGAVVPDGEVVDVLPAVAHLQVVVLDDQGDEPVQEALGLVVREPFDPLHVRAYREHALPARHRVRADNRVVRLQRLAHVLRSAPRPGEDLEPVVCRCRVEGWLCAVRRQAL